MFPIAALLEFGTKLIDKFFPDPTQAAKAKADLLQMQVQGELQQMASQLEINKVEAANTSVFVSGWRPAIGWVCAVALFYQYLVRPLAIWFLLSINHPIPNLPGLDDNLWQLMMGMLGLGGLRTYEKVAGVTK